jgi:MFS family permease
MKNNTKIKYDFISLSFVFIIIINSLAFLGFNMGTTGFPAYMSSIADSSVYLALVTSTTALAALLTRPLFGCVVDRVNPLYFLIVGILLMSLPCYFILMTKANNTILFMRGIQGVGWGITSTVCSKCIADILPKERLSEGIGYAGVISSIATAFAPSLATFIFQSFGYNEMIAFIGIVTLMALPLLFFCKSIFKKDSIRRKSSNYRFDINRKIILSSIIIFSITFCYSPIITFITKFSNEYNIKSTFMFFLIYAFATVISRPITGYYVDRKGVFLPIIVAITSMLLCLLCLYFCYDIILLNISAFFAGISTGCGMNSLQTLALKNTSCIHRGKTIAIFLFGFDLGMAIGAFVFGLFIDMLGFHLLFILYEIVTISALILFLSFKTTKIK